MTSHSHMTRHHRPPHVRRKLRLWAPLAALGVAVYVCNFHDAGAALAGAALATVGLLGLIGDNTTT
ncbi:hypothetical protein [Nesterenkonia sp. HG001]|uniref:hypothetical protein n=1 Tax=Nesterenkonia sp. HG001 TaxID=2983207 RepID=UPI002AC74FC2|nr:hypothetical protein [Nesterenkonia sp. HG001]MDZ5077895.1 hypothetical protein [Nesterenkonia sp. HG001]